jgi:hypothetical protein
MQNQDIFNEIQAELFSLMNSDIWHRFKRSPLYAAYVRRGLFFLRFL